MKKLRATRKAKSYKRIDAYLNQVWKQNKDYLEAYIEDLGGAVQENFGSLEKYFKTVVKEIWKDKEYDDTLNRKIKTYDEAIDKAMRSSLIKQSRHYSELVVEQISSNKEEPVYQQIRGILKNKKFNPDNIDYIGGQTTKAGSEEWYKYNYRKTEQYQGVALKGKRKGQIITKKRTVDKEFYIVFHVSVKSGGGGWYEIIEQPSAEELKNLT